MLKRIIATLCSAALLLLSLQTGSLAAEYEYEKYYDDNTSFASGIGGKRGDDRSCNTKQDYYNVIELKEKITIEYNLYHISAWANQLTFVYTTPEALNVTTRVIDTQGSGKIKFRLDNIVYPIQNNVWTRIALTYDPSLSENNAILYINGVEISTGTLPLPRASVTQLRVILDQVGDYVDDFVVYYGDYNPPQKPILTPVGGVTEADNTANSVNLPKIPVSEISSKISFSDGSSAVSVCDGSELKAKDADEFIESGDKLVVAASDGMTYYYYDITASGEYYAENFSGVDSDGSVSDQPVGNGTLSNGISEMSLGGKSEEDVSVRLSDEANNFTMPDVDFLSGDYITIEYNVLKVGSDGQHTLKIGDASPFPVFDDSEGGSVVYNGEKLTSYEIGKWYRVAVSIDVYDSTYDYFLNGKCILENEELSDLATMPVVFGGGSVCIDDIKIYSDIYIPISVSLPTVKFPAKSDDDYMHVAFFEDADAENIGKYFEYDSSVGISVVDKDNFKTKTSGKISIGDSIAFSSDNVNFRFYTVVEKVFDDFDTVSAHLKCGNEEVSLDEIRHGDSISVEYVLQNKTEEDKSGYLVIAVYEEKELVYFDIQKISVAAGSTPATDASGCTFTSSKDYTASATPDCINVYLWKSMTQRSLLINSYNFN